MKQNLSLNYRLTITITLRDTQSETPSLWLHFNYFIIVYLTQVLPLVKGYNIHYCILNTYASKLET